MSGWVPIERSMPNTFAPVDLYVRSHQGVGRRIPDCTLTDHGWVGGGREEGDVAVPIEIGGQRVTHWRPVPRAPR